MSGAGMEKPPWPGTVTGLEAHVTEKQGPREFSGAAPPCQPWTVTSDHPERKENVGLLKSLRFVALFQPEPEPGDPT